MYPPTALHFYNGMKKLVILTIRYSTNFGNTFTTKNGSNVYWQYVFCEQYGA